MVCLLEKCYILNEIILLLKKIFNARQLVGNKMKKEIFINLKFNKYTLKLGALYAHRKTKNVNNSYSVTKSRKFKGLT